MATRFVALNGLLARMLHDSHIQKCVGAWAWKPQLAKPLSPIPEPIGARDLMQKKVFTGPRRALIQGSHWELWFLH